MAYRAKWYVLIVAALIVATGWGYTGLLGSGNGLEQSTAAAATLARDKQDAHAEQRQEKQDHKESVQEARAQQRDEKKGLITTAATTTENVTSSESVTPAGLERQGRAARRNEPGVADTTLTVSLTVGTLTTTSTVTTCLLFNRKGVCIDNGGVGNGNGGKDNGGGGNGNGGGGGNDNGGGGNGNGG